MFKTFFQVQIKDWDEVIIAEGRYRASSNANYLVLLARTKLISSKEIYHSDPKADIKPTEGTLQKR